MLENSAHPAVYTCCGYNTDSSVRHWFAESIDDVIDDEKGKVVLKAAV
jgi:hypothetical protein